MANTEVLTGLDGAVKIGSDALVYVDQWSLTISQTVADVKKLGTMWTGKRGTGKAATGSIGGSFAESDTGVVALRTAMVTDTETRVDLHLVHSATMEYSGPAVLSDIQISTAADGVSTWTANFAFDGAPVAKAPTGGA